MGCRRYDRDANGLIDQKEMMGVLRELGVLEGVKVSPLKYLFPIYFLELKLHA